MAKEMERRQVGVVKELLFVHNPRELFELNIDRCRIRMTHDKPGHGSPAERHGHAASHWGFHLFRDQIGEKSVDGYGAGDLGEASVRHSAGVSASESSADSSTSALSRLRSSQTGRLRS